MLTRYYQELLNFCLRRARDRDMAADLAQEACLRVLSMQQAGQAVLDPPALLKRVAAHAKIDMDRRAAVREADDIDALEESRQPAAPLHLQPDEAVAASQVLAAYLRVLETLPPRCREAFSLYVFDEFSKEEIAERMGISLSMVKQYIIRGKAACAACRDAAGGPAGQGGR